MLSYVLWETDNHQRDLTPAILRFKARTGVNPTMVSLPVGVAVKTNLEVLVDKYQPRCHLKVGIHALNS